MQNVIVDTKYVDINLIKNCIKHSFAHEVVKTPQKSTVNVALYLAKGLIFYKCKSV